ncbi:MAG TPA: hypothetical protein VN495_03875 [Candidatus Paceibacterota bacterium]|nr:hypothetical protein [Candidatus Paceibacterota bacterium]
MTKREAARCEWIHFGVGKGVSNPCTGVSIYGTPGESMMGMHGEMIQGLPGIDTSPRCYEDDHALGFGEFVRWVYFANPLADTGILGIDWSLSARKTAGVAHSMARVAAVARTCMESGIPAESRLALLNWRMLEPAYLSKFRRGAGLNTVLDWAARGPDLFGSGSDRCPRCGLKTLTQASRFCNRCGCRPEYFWKEKRDDER